MTTNESQNLFTELFRRRLARLVERRPERLRSDGPEFTFPAFDTTKVEYCERLIEGRREDEDYPQYWAAFCRVGDKRYGVRGRVVCDAIWPKEHANHDRRKRRGWFFCDCKPRLVPNRRAVLAFRDYAMDQLAHAACHEWKGAYDEARRAWAMSERDRIYGRA